MSPKDTTGRHDMLRPVLFSLRTLLMNGATQQKMHGEGIMENTSKSRVISESESRRARRFGELVYADGAFFVYHYKGDLYYMTAPDDLIASVQEKLNGVEVHNTGRPVDTPLETAHSRTEFDPAVLMHITHELAHQLRTSHLQLIEQFGDEGITRIDQAICLEGNRDVLELYASEYGVEWEQETA